MTDRTQAVRVVENVLYCFNTSVTPTDGDWQRFLDVLRQGEVKKVLVASNGGGPGIMQRASFGSVCKDQGVRVAVLTENKVVRGMVRAVSWLGVAEIKAFACDDVAGAAEFLGTTLATGEVDATFASLANECATAWERK